MEKGFWTGSKRRTLIVPVQRHGRISGPSSSESSAPARHIRHCGSSAAGSAFAFAGGAYGGGGASLRVSGRPGSATATGTGAGLPTSRSILFGPGCSLIGVSPFGFGLLSEDDEDEDEDGEVEWSDWAGLREVHDDEPDELAPASSELSESAAVLPRAANRFLSILPPSYAVFDGPAPGVEDEDVI